jgi:integrase
MSVHQLKDGRWVARFPKGTLKDDPGRTCQYFGRGIEGESAARQFNESLPLKKYIRTPEVMEPTFTEIATAYFKFKQARLPAASIDALWYKLDSVILPAIGAIPVNRLTERDLDRFVKKRLSSAVKVRIGPRHAPKFKPVKDPEGNVRTISPTTVHRELDDIQAVLNWAAKPNRRLISSNPVRHYEKIKRRDRVVLPPTPAEAAALVKHAPEHLKRFLIIAYYCGARPGASELLSLTWDKVDLDGGTILIVSARKGGRESRLIPLKPDFKKFLQEWKLADGDNARYLITWRGRPIKRISGAFKRAKKKAGIDPNRKMPPYSLRHAFVTVALNSGGDLKGVSEMAGHTRTETTTRIYQHTNINLHRGIVENMPSLPLDTSKSCTKKHAKSDNNNSGI